MKLNIINYNPDYVRDVNIITKITTIIDNLKDNINGIYYEPYKNFLKKINNCFDMLIKIFEKELEEVKKDSNNEDSDSDGDNISIDSISEYEDDYEDKDKDVYQIEVKQINDFEKNINNKLNLIKNRFEFKFVKLYE